jgi:hypothetical protein
MMKQCSRKNRWRMFAAALVSVFLPGLVWGYVMPTGQLIDFMAENFSRFQTLILKQTTHLTHPEREEAGVTFQQKVWLKAPDRVRSEILTGMDIKDWAAGELGKGRAKVDTAFWALLLANGEEALVRRLSEMGIDIEAVAFTRIDGIVAYRIGRWEEDQPKLLIEKERFLPLFVSYRSETSPGEGLVRIRFKDYRALPQGRFPYELIYSVTGGLTEHYFIDALEVNPPISSALFESQEKAPVRGTTSEDKTADPDEQRLQEIVRALRQRHRQPTAPKD